MLLFPLSPIKGFLISRVMLAFSACGAMFTLGAVMIGEIPTAHPVRTMLGVTNSIHTSAGLLAPVVMGRLINISVNSATELRDGFILANIFVITLGATGMILMYSDVGRARFAVWRDPGTLSHKLAGRSTQRV